MYEPDDNNDPIGSALSSRRIKHSHGRKNQRGGGGKGKSKGGGGGIFDPLRALGHYEVQLGSNSKRTKQNHESRSGLSSWLEIHELTEDDDGLVGSFSFNDGQFVGICILAGSRKGLAKIIDELESASVDDEDEDEDEDENDSTNNDDEGVKVVDQTHDESTTGDNHGSSSDEREITSDNEQSTLEAADEKYNRRIRNFEKNSFRNPKFWLRWKRHVEARAQGQFTAPQLELEDGDRTEATASMVESDMGYIVFANNECDRFEGTITCPALEWDNFKMTGWKTRSKAMPTVVEWAAFE